MKKVLALLIKMLKVKFSSVENKDYAYKKTIFYGLKDMGGVYIKFLQVLAVMNKFMEGWSSPKEYEIFNQVVYEPINLDEMNLNQESFSYIEQKPFASGSFAQIYKAELKNGKQVVIKVLKPSISKTLKKDLKTLKRIVKFVSFCLPNGVIDYSACFQEFSNVCLLETDYEREIANIKYFRNMYENHPYIIVPEVYEELCTKNIIVEDYIEGLNLADALSLLKKGDNIEEFCFNKTGSNIWSQLVIVGGESLRTAMVCDYVFGDPHPGNLILLPNNKIAFIDFGIIAKRPKSQEAFYLWMKSYYNFLMEDNNLKDFFETSCMCFCPDYANAFKKYFNDVDVLSLLAKYLSDETKRVRNQNEKANNRAKHGHLFTFFSDFINEDNAINLKIDMDNYQLIKSMQAFLCSVTSLDNKFGEEYFSKIMLGAMEYALKYVDQVGINHDFSYKTKYSVDDSYEMLIDLFSSLADNNEFLFKNISERMFL